MGLFDWLTTKFNAGDVTRSTITDRQIHEALINQFGGGLIPLADNPKSYVTNGYNANLFVHMIVAYIAKRAAQIPIVLERYRPDGTSERVTDHPILDLLEKPNLLQSGNELREQAIGFYLLTGNTYQLKVYSSTREDALPIEIYNLPSQYVEIDAKYTKRGAGLINKFKLNVFEDVNFQPDQILHIKTPNYSYENGEWLYGQSPLKAGLRTLNLSNSTTDAMTKQAQNQGALGLMMYDVNGNDGQTITPEQLRAFKAELHKAVAGTENRGRAVALSRMFKWQQLGMTAADMQLIEDHNLTRSDLCALYDLSSILFNDNAASTFNNVQEAKKSAYTEAIIPAAKTYIDGFNRDVIQKVDPDLYLSLDTSAIEVLKKDNAALISTLQNAWWLPTSKKQSMVGMEPDGTLPEYLLPMNLIPVDQLTDEAMADIEQRAQSDPEVAKQYNELAKKYKDYFDGM